MDIPAGAVWIASDHPFDLHEAYLNFRKDIEIESLPAEATLHVAADDRYRLWINGVPVARGPSRSWPHARQVDAIPVTRHLHKGLNAVAVQVYSPGYSHFASVHRGAHGLLLWLAAANGIVLATDSTWRVQRDPSWKAEVPRVSIYGTGVEVRDLRKDTPWQTGDASAWAPARVMQPAEGPVWSGLQPRDVPLLETQNTQLSHAFAFRRSLHPPAQAEPHEMLRSALAACPAQPQPAPGPLGLQAGETAIWVFDLGHSRTCQACIEVTGAKGGETMLVSYAEKLRHGAVLLSDPATYCRMRLTDHFTLRPGRQQVDPFSQRGGRYVIVLLHAPQAATIELQFSITETLYPVALTREPEHGDAALNAILLMCWRTISSTLQDGFVDSVWRESSQWLGDAVAQAFALSAVSDDLRPLRRVITMAAAGAYADGVLPSVLPGEVHAYAITDYNFSWVELLDFYCRHAAAPEPAPFFAAMFPNLQRMLQRFRADVREDGLIRSQAGRRLFLDWSPVDRREPNLTYNLRYLHALQLAAALAGHHGMSAEGQVWAKDAHQLCTAIRNAFRVGNQWQENQQGVAATQLALALALLTDCAEKTEAEALADRIIDRSLDLADQHQHGQLVLASPFMHHYVFQALEKQGRQEAILKIIKARWGRWAAAGEPTTWENWNVDFPDGSKCHGFSAHPLGWILRLSR